MYEVVRRDRREGEKGRRGKEGVKKIGEKLDRGRVNKAIGKTKDGKTVGADEIPGET